MKITENTIINTHTHIFDGVKDVPNGFLPLGLKRIVSTKVGFWIVSKIMGFLNPASQFFGMTKDAFDRYIQFVEIGKLGSQKAIFENMKVQYLDDTAFVVLPMQMQYMGAGDTPRPYEEQITELRDLVKVYPNIIPFVAIDCRMPDCFNFFVKCIEEYGFKGLKLYPPLGSFPYDKRYYPIYEYCQGHGIPVIAHQSDGNPVYFKGSQDDLIQLLQGYNGCAGAIDWSIPRDNKALCAYFTHPLGYKQVMNDFPNLKICLAHYGKGNEEPNDCGGMDWDDIVCDMMKTYPNLYTDIAYSMYNKKWWSSVKVQLSTNKLLHDKLMWGSDFYMLACDGTEKEYCVDFRAFLGENLFQQIARTNPMKFLGL